MNLFIEKFKQNPLLGVGLTVILFCGGFVLLRANQMNLLAAKEDELINQLETIRENIKHSKNIEQDIQDLEAQVATIKERLFVKEERAINVNFFYKFEEKLNVMISGVEQLDSESLRFVKGGPDELKLYSVIPYSITINGTFQEVLKFLYEIYQLEAIMRVTDFQIDAIRNNDGTSRNLVANLQVAVLAENEVD